MPLDWPDLAARGQIPEPERALILPDSAVLPSGENVTEVTPSECPNCSTFSIFGISSARASPMTAPPRNPKTQIANRKSQIATA